MISFFATELPSPWHKRSRPRFSGRRSSFPGNECQHQCDIALPANVCRPVASEVKQNSPLPNGSVVASELHSMLCRVTSATINRYSVFLDRHQGWREVLHAPAPLPSLAPRSHSVPRHCANHDQGKERAFQHVVSNAGGKSDSTKPIIAWKLSAVKGL